MAHRKNNKKLQSGFTLIEVIAVLVIIAVLAAVAVSRVISTKEVSAITEAEILKMHLRYAQMRALSYDTAWGIDISSNNSYTLKQYKNEDDDGAVTVTSPYNLPNENSATHTFPQGITATGSNVIFDEWGCPVDESGSPITDEKALKITVSNGGGTIDINIKKNTGFIP